MLKVTSDLAEDRRNWVSPQPACSQGSRVLHPGPCLLFCQLLPVGRGGPPVSPRRVGGPLSLPVRESGGPLQPRQERPHLPALSPGTFSAPWAALARSREQYCLAWEAKYLMELGNALETILSGLANMVAQEALKYTVLSGEPPLSPASSMPTTPKPHWSCAFAGLRPPGSQALFQSLGDPVCGMVIMVFIGRK